MKTPLTIVKVGGNVIDDPVALDAFLQDFSALQGFKILVHGGGKKATKLAADLGFESKMIEGRRVTDGATLEVSAMVYGGLLSKNIVALLQKNNCNAIGISGADANCIVAHKRIVKDIDYGFVGDIDAVHTKNIKVFLSNGMVPVFCALTHDQKGQLLNTNADSIASNLAVGLAGEYEVSLIYTFEKKGVLRSVSDENSVIESIDSLSYTTLKETQVITEGMLPKMENCFHALQQGVAKVIIGNTKVLLGKEPLFTTLTL